MCDRPSIPDYSLAQFLVKNIAHGSLVFSMLGHCISWHIVCHISIGKKVQVLWLEPPDIWLLDMLFNTCCSMETQTISSLKFLMWNMSVQHFTLAINFCSIFRMYVCESTVWMVQKCKLILQWNYLAAFLHQFHFQLLSLEGKMASNMSIYRSLISNLLLHTLHRHTGSISLMPEHVTVPLSKNAVCAFQITWKLLFFFLPGKIAEEISRWSMHFDN